CKLAIYPKKIRIDGHSSCVPKRCAFFIFRAYVYNKTYRLGIRKMLKVIGAMLSQIQGDALLLSNGSTEVFKKEKEVLYVNNIEEFAKYPFEELGISYKNIIS
ncbi:hypothetical protein ACIQ57_16855, partial [Lysinibacillus xylanilyticus]|uniref:hypothetical protein n=1 Tax=Lysinibacillus xylanilyticus TaxID=582475 RepID=UPI0038055F29